MQRSILTCGVLLAFFFAGSAGAISIVLDYTLDAKNQNWFDPQTPAGLMRRNAVDAAAGFLSNIVTNDDWQALPTLNETFTLSDIAASTIFDLDGNQLTGTPESDGAGYSYTASSNDIHTTNRSGVAANEYVVYVGAFAFDTGSSANANGGWDSNDRRNAAGFAGTEFNTWGGKITFNTAKNWYAGSNPGFDPTDDYGVQDPNKNPSFDMTTDNWDWNPTSRSWKGFELRTIDPTAAGQTDLYATAVHELMHALGATTDGIEDYVGVNASGDFIGENLMQVYGGPVPGAGGHFEENVQSFVWGSDSIVSEVVLDPNSLSGVRKYFTQVDAALLRDLGYQVLSNFHEAPLPGDYNGDGAVDAADYTIWRDLLGQTGEHLAADGSGPEGVSDGAVDLLDYEFWKSRFDATDAGGLPAGAAVPEPSTMTCVIGLLAPILFELRKRRGTSPREGATRVGGRSGWRFRWLV